MGFRYLGLMCQKRLEVENIIIVTFGHKKYLNVYRRE